MKGLWKRFIMRESCFIDSSIFYHIIVTNRTDLLRKLSKFVLFTSTNVLEEVSYKKLLTPLQKTSYKRRDMLI